MPTPLLASAASLPDIPIGVPSKLLERRPDVAAAERQVAAANAEIGVAKSAFYPALTLTAGGSSRTAVVADLLTMPTRFWSVGAELAQTLFDAGRRRAQVTVVQATYDATVANYRQTVLTGFQQVEDTLAALRVLADESAIIDRAVDAAKRSLDISTTQYRGGLTNYLQVITAQTNLLQNQRAAAEILTRRHVASVTLIQALGGGWDAKGRGQRAALCPLPLSPFGSAGVNGDAGRDQHVPFGSVPHRHRGARNNRPGLEGGGRQDECQLVRLLAGARDHQRLRADGFHDPADRVSGGADRGNLGHGRGSGLDPRRREQRGGRSRQGAHEHHDRGLVQHGVRTLHGGGMRVT